MTAAYVQTTASQGGQRSEDGDRMTEDRGAKGDRLRDCLGFQMSDFPVSDLM